MMISPTEAHIFAYVIEWTTSEHELGASDFDKMRRAIQEQREQIDRTTESRMTEPNSETNENENKNENENENANEKEKNKNAPRSSPHHP
jgi:hypothetical protein